MGCPVYGLAGSARGRGGLERTEKSERQERSKRSWIVDGYNVLRVSLSAAPGNAAAPLKWWSEERRAVLTSIAARLPYPDDEIILVFDARHLSRAQLPADADPVRPRVRHVFAPSADEWIVSALQQRDESEQAVVVTADRPLADRARHRGAEVMATGEFVALCGGDASAQPSGLNR